MKTRGQNNTVCRTYVLMTAAYNEEALIEGTIKSVVSQTLLPKRWMIVSDGSTDRTDEIVRKYAQTYPFVQLLRLEKNHDRNFVAQASAIIAGFEKLRSLDFDFVGNLDADITLEPEYFERLLQKFEADPRLGLAGGFIYEEARGQFRSRAANRSRSVAHAIQLFRRECYEAIGGYVPLPYIGTDYHAEVCARMKGWRVEAFSDLPVCHHRPTGAGTGSLRYFYRLGLMEFTLGSHPLFVIGKHVHRLARTHVVGSLTALVAFALAYCRGEKRGVSDEFVAFLRQDQMNRMRAGILHFFRPSKGAGLEDSVQPTSQTPGSQRDVRAGNLKRS